MRNLMTKGLIACVVLAGVTSAASARAISVWGLNFTVADEAPSPAVTTPALRDPNTFNGTATRHHLRRTVLPVDTLLPRH